MSVPTIRLAAWLKLVPFSSMEVAGCLMRLHRWLTALFGGPCALSIVPVFTGDDPLSGIFVVVLGSPWIQLLRPGSTNSGPVKTMAWPPGSRWE